MRTIAQAQIHLASRGLRCLHDTAADVFHVVDTCCPEDRERYTREEFLVRWCGRDDLPDDRTSFTL